MTGLTPSLIVTDLDGTLWHTDDEVHHRTRAALERIGREGPPLLVATGRRLSSARGPLAGIGVAPCAIVLNGALGVDLADDVRFHVAPYGADDAAAVLAAFTAVGLSPCVYVDDPAVEVFVGGAPSTNPGHLADLRPTAGVGDLASVVRDSAVLGFSLVGVERDVLQPAVAALGGLGEVHLDRSLDYPGTATLTVAPRSQSKWDGVLALCAARGLDPTRVVALGDGPNDVELLAAAAVALVPEDAHPAALALADVVIAPPERGGWAQVLDLL